MRVTNTIINIIVLLLAIIIFLAGAFISRKVGLFYIPLFIIYNLANGGLDEWL